MSGHSIWGLGSSFLQLGAYGTSDYSFQSKSVSSIPKIHPFKKDYIGEYQASSKEQKDGKEA